MLFLTLCILTIDLTLSYYNIDVVLCTGIFIAFVLVGILCLFSLLYDRHLAIKEYEINKSSFSEYQQWRCDQYSAKSKFICCLVLFLQFGNLPIFMIVLLQNNVKLNQAVGFFHSIKSCYCYPV